MKTVSLTSIARAKNIDPKTARARLRRAYKSSSRRLPKPIDEHRWVFNEKSRSTIEKLIAD